MRNAVAAAVLAFFVLLLGAGPANGQASNVTYDAFMTLDRAARLDTFARITAANRLELLREQLIRWRRLRADSLTLEQHRFLDEVAASIRVEDLDDTHRRRSRAEVDAFLDRQRRASELFTQEESLEAFTLTGSYIRQQQRRHARHGRSSRVSSFASLTFPTLNVLECDVYTVGLTTIDEHDTVRSNR